MRWFALAAGALALAGSSAAAANGAGGGQMLDGVYAAVFNDGLMANAMLVTVAIGLFCAWAVMRRLGVADERGGATIVNEKWDAYASENASRSNRWKNNKVPRELLKNPYGAGFDHLDFEERVQIAAQGSLETDRVIGVIYFQIDPRLGGDDVDMAALAERFARLLRKTDCVRTIGEGEIAVFISLLANRVDLQKIARRLLSAAYKGGSITNIAYPGLAMYPLDGYTATELIEAARLDLDGVAMTIAAGGAAPGAKAKRWNASVAND